MKSRMADRDLCSNIVAFSVKVEYAPFLNIILNSAAVSPSGWALRSAESSACFLDASEVARGVRRQTWTVAHGSDQCSDSVSVVGEWHGGSDRYRKLAVSAAVNDRAMKELAISRDKGV
jgi:hypothetical protein